MLPPEATRHLSVLDDLLADCFSGAELVRLVEHTFGSQATADLPVTAESSRLFMYSAVRALLRRGLLADPFFAALAQARPQRTAEIRRIAGALTFCVDVDPSETQTLVWRGGAAEGSRLTWVQALEHNLLARDRLAPTDDAAPTLERAIDGLARRIRGAPMLAAGSVLAMTRLERVLGAGNFGTVWRARHTKTGEQVATKVFNLDRLTDGVMLWRFRRSIRALESLNRYRDKPASIPSLLAEAPDSLAFVMPYYSGGTLEQIERRGWSLATKLAVFLEVCQAVEFAHKVGIIHRDIKPGNVLLDDVQRPVLIDYDIADISFVTQLEATPGGLGTPVFAAPEQLEDAATADERSDIYSLGRLLHYLLIERSPGYQIESDPALDNLHGFHPALVAAVRQATQWAPKRRQASVAQLVADVERHRTGYAMLRARCTGTWRWVRQHGMVLAVFATIAGASAGVASMQRDLAETRKTTIDAVIDITRRNDENSHALAQLLDRLEQLASELAGLGSDITSMADASPEVILELTAQLPVRLATLEQEAQDIRRGLGGTARAVQDEQDALWETLSAVAPTAPPDTLSRPEPPGPDSPHVRPQPPLKREWSMRGTDDALLGQAAEAARETRPDAAIVPIKGKRRPRSRDTHKMSAILAKFQSALVGCVTKVRSEDHQLPLSVRLRVDLRGRIRKPEPSRQLQAGTKLCIEHVLQDVDLGPSRRKDNYEHTIIPRPA